MKFSGFFFTICSWISGIYHRWKVHCYCDLQTLQSRFLFLYDFNLVYTIYRFFSVIIKFFLVIFEKTKIAIVNMTSWPWLFKKKWQYDFLNNDYYLGEIWLFSIWVLFFVWRNITKLHFYAQRIVLTITFFYLYVTSGGFKGYNKGAIHVCILSWDKIDKN